MPLLGQASTPGLAGSSSALEVLYGGIFNSVGITTDDGFTQSNPPVSTGAQISTQVDTAVTGVLSGSVAFTRPDIGSNYIGGPAQPAGDIAELVRVVGVFINSAAGNALENQPAAASGKSPYMSGQGTYGNQLYESQNIGAASGGIAQGDPITYQVGASLVASVNGYLTPVKTFNGATAVVLDATTSHLEEANGATSVTIIGRVKVIPDSEEDRVVYDQLL